MPPAIHVLRTVAEVRAARRGLPPAGLVPTMGSLHEGHLKLVDAARRGGEATTTQTWASVFVNPSQFAPHEDFSKYPRNLERDVELLRGRGVQFVFAPEPKELYPGIALNQTSTNVQRTVVVPVGVEQDQAEGRTRPGHFAGVATVVTKLFNIIQPSQAFFGQKDGLQCIVIKQVVRDLNMPVDVVVVPTEREPDMLAMSSRNVYLSPEQRKVAPVLYESLSRMRRAFQDGERSYDKLRAVVRDRLLEVARAQPASATYKIDYVSIVDANTGVEESPDRPVGDHVMCSSAIHFGNCRILDNVVCSA